jgi:hypothetical protein
VDLEEIKRRHEQKAQELERLELEAAPIRGRGESLPTALRCRIAGLKCEVDELRLWGFKARTEDVADYMQNEDEKY